MMTDPLALGYLRAIDASAARIAASLEALIKIADELATVREERRQDATDAPRIERERQAEYLK